MSDRVIVSCPAPVCGVRPRRDERGSGSMLMIGVCVVVMMLGYTAITYPQTIIAV